MGDVEQLAEHVDVTSYTYQKLDQGQYRRLVLLKGRLVGAMAIGDWSQVNILQQAISEKRFIWPWQSWRFKRFGFLYPQGQPKNVNDWASPAIVCNCTGVTREQIGDVIIQGCRDSNGIKRETSASTVCGSCKHLSMNCSPENQNMNRLTGQKPLLSYPVSPCFSGWQPLACQAAKAFYLILPSIKSGLTQSINKLPVSRY